MPLERQNVIVFDATPRIEVDGTITRNKVLQPCGCWAAEVWRSVAPPTGVTMVTMDLPVETTAPGAG